MRNPFTLLINITQFIHKRLLNSLHATFPISIINMLDSGLIFNVQNRYKNGLIMFSAVLCHLYQFFSAYGLEQDPL